MSHGFSHPNFCRSPKDVCKAGVLFRILKASLARHGAIRKNTLIDLSRWWQDQQVAASWMSATSRKPPILLCLAISKVSFKWSVIFNNTSRKHVFHWFLTCFVSINMLCMLSMLWDYIWPITWSEFLKMCDMRFERMHILQLLDVCCLHAHEVKLNTAAVACLFFGGVKEDRVSPQGAVVQGHSSILNKLAVRCQ